MFRCVDRAPAPREPSLVDDPLWNRMAALYEHVGDLAAQGNPAVTTEAYQEALGIQIAHQGTKVATPLMSPLPLPAIAVAHAMSFLHVAEVLALLCVNRSWQEASKMGRCWRSHFKHRWAGSSEVIADTVFKFDAELKDWFGMYRRACILEGGRSGICTIFIDAKLKAQKKGCDPIPSVPALVRHIHSGAAWDRSLKQRAGWHVGSQYASTSWIKHGSVDWTVFSAILDSAFRNLDAKPSEHRVVLPIVPEVMDRSFRERVAKILHRRFEVPRVHTPPAPLCALLAHGLSTGIVVWASSVGTCAIFCYQDAREAGTFGEFTYRSGHAHEIVDILERVAKVLIGTDGAGILRHIVFSFQELVEPSRRLEAGRWVEAEEEKEPWFFAVFEEIQSFFREKGLWPGTTLLRPIPDDVLKGADVLSSSLQHLQAYEVTPEEAGIWEWRMELEEGTWSRLPAYVVGVLEGALRGEQNFAFLKLSRPHVLVADLEAFTISVAKCRRFMPTLRIAENAGKELVFHAKYRLTRFLRGRPSATPDRRSSFSSSCSARRGRSGPPRGRRRSTSARSPANSCTPCLPPLPPTSSRAICWGRSPLAWAARQGS